MPDKSIPPRGPGLSLAGLEPFARGQHRHCYVHPEDPDLCVKVPARARDEGCRAAQRMDIEDHALLKARGGAELFDRIPEIESVVGTDRGEGIVMRLYRDPDGSISRPLDRLIAERGLPGLVPAIDDWKRWVRRQRLLTRDTGPHNLVGVRLGPDEWKLVMIEGWLKRKYRRLAALHPALLRLLIDSELRKFDRRAAGRKKLLTACAAMINPRGNR